MVASRVRLVVLAVLVLALNAGQAGLARASTWTSIAQLGVGYIHEDGRLFYDDPGTFTTGQPAYAVGRVTAFLGPLAHLDASAAGVEYTWVTVDQVSAWGVLGDNAQDCHLSSWEFVGGRFRMLRDTTPDSDLAQPSTYADGEILLEGSMSGLFQFSMWEIWCPDDSRERGFTMNVTLDGGSALNPVGLGAEAVSGLAGGSYTLWSELPASILGLDYFAGVEATLSVDAPVGVSPTTWGRLKSLYR